MDCTEKKKVKLATFLLQEGAEDWWTLYGVGIGKEGISEWDDFKKAFRNKFYPRSFCDTKRSEFMNLVEGNMIVIEYKKRFTELAKYALAF